MSPRAACRLATLGFTDVYDYVAGKADWLAYGLPVEGEHAEVLTAGRVARPDVVTCHLRDPVSAILERVELSPYGFALALSDNEVILGRLRASTMKSAAPDATAEDVMEAGPSTVRADTPASELGQRLADLGLTSAIVSTPEGRLVGVVTRTGLRGRGGDRTRPPA